MTATGTTACLAQDPMNSAQTVRYATSVDALLKTFLLLGFVTLLFSLLPFPYFSWQGWDQGKASKTLALDTKFRVVQKNSVIKINDILM